jgi:hypothetical protein
MLCLIPRWIKIRFLEVELDFITGFTQGGAVMFILELTRFAEISISEVTRYKSKKKKNIEFDNCMIFEL